MKREQVKEIIEQLCDENGLKGDARAAIISSSLLSYEWHTNYGVVDENAATLAAFVMVTTLLQQQENESN